MGAPTTTAAPATTAAPVTTAAPATTASSSSRTALERVWTEVGSNVACDGRAGETFLANSPGRVSSLEQCKTSCENAPGCKSITYFKRRWCSHFSTPCTNTKANNKAVALRLSFDSDITTTKGVAMRWVQVATKVICDITA